MARRSTSQPSESKVGKALLICQRFWGSNGDATHLMQAESDLRALDLSHADLLRTYDYLPTTTGSTASLVTRVAGVVRRLAEESNG